jgi:hypothetical protein
LSVVLLLTIVFSVVLLLTIVLSVVLLLNIVVCCSSGYPLGIFKLFIIQRKTGFKK